MTSVTDEVEDRPEVARRKEATLCGISIGRYALIYRRSVPGSRFRPDHADIDLIAGATVAPGALAGRFPAQVRLPRRTGLVHPGGWRVVRRAVEEILVLCGLCINLEKGLDEGV